MKPCRNLDGIHVYVAIAVEGAALDTVAVCPPLTIVERSRLEELKAREHERVAPEMAKARTAFVESQARTLVARTGMTAKAARQVIIRRCEGVLLPDVELPFDDPALAGCTVGDVLTDPERFEGETLADPLEGVSYGRCVAKVMRRADGTPWNSFVCPWPHHLRDQARRQRRTQGDAAVGEGRGGGDLCPACRRCRPRRDRDGGAAPAGKGSLRRRPARHQ